ncbi:hypothetical protein C1646_777627 [Rhizophagus diaphanus]|nr:hypothetical protein C1646_777627 [Rhizophagus diaphanus] [Rhizophagus sp. MUCL 43196]
MRFVLSELRKKPEESGQNNLLTKYYKFNSSIQSTLEKVLEEQLAQHIIIDNLQKNNEELKCEVLENQKLLQNIHTILTSEPTIMTQQTKQHLKRKDTKHIWWDALMTTACHKLFQVNKNPSDTEVEQAFKLQIQADFPQKIQELVNLNEWNNLRDLWKKIDDSNQKSPCIIEVILQKAFSKEELQNKNNIKFGVIVALMFLDPTYNQIKILSSKVQERMNQWDSNSIIPLSIDVLKLTAFLVFFNDFTGQNSPFRQNFKLPNVGRNLV